VRYTAQQPDILKNKSNSDHKQKQHTVTPDLLNAYSSKLKKAYFCVWNKTLKI
jgi:hypothetical protein